MMGQLSIFDFINSRPVPNIYGRFIIKLTKDDYQVWFRDFIDYHLKPDKKLKELTSVYFSTYRERITSFDYKDICKKHYGWYQSHLNEYDYTKRDEVFEEIIKTLKLNTNLSELLEMTINDFITTYAFQPDQEVYDIAGKVGESDD